VTAERFTPEALEAAHAEYDAQDRAVAGGQVVMDFVQVGVMVSLLAPREWEEVAAYLYALLERAPVRDGKAFVAHRTVLAALAGELRGYARSAGVPVGGNADLRAAGSLAEEQRIRQRLADQAAAFDRHIDDVIASHHAQAELAAEDDHEEESPASEPTSTEDPDAAYLL
jgi:hypothetical protein